MQNQKINLLFGVILLFGSSTAPSHAQAANPLAIGSSLLQPLRYFSYSPWGGNGQTNPIWWGGKILQQTSRGTGGVGYGGYSPYGNPNFYQINADEHNPNPNPNANPQQVIRYGYPNSNQFNNQNQNQNQQNNGTSAFQSSRNGGQNFTPTNQANAQGPDPFLTPISGAGGSTGNNYARPGSPHNPTSYGSGNSRGKAPKPSKNAPFANSFIDTVNTKYNGDISRAMSDQNTRDMARSLGLMNKSQGELNLSEDRKGAIGHILRDDSLDTDSKMTALKALMH
ncbi:MAG: hypothetical protein P4L53_09145 [Candidatus Obscuribacterales bacterium]|nr:hypothetical protein [Candidatus Obscuribacterales bacterium]